MIDAKGCQGKHLTLGVQTNPGKVLAKADWLARQWASKQARSFTIQSLRHTDYDGNASDVETGYARIKIAYFTTKKEGENII